MTQGRPADRPTRETRRCREEGIGVSGYRWRSRKDKWPLSDFLSRLICSSRGADQSAVPISHILLKHIDEIFFLSLRREASLKSSQVEIRPHSGEKLSLTFKKKKKKVFTSFSGLIEKQS